MPGIETKKDPILQAQAVMSVGTASSPAENNATAGRNSWAWLPFLICALPSFLLLAFVPPTFNFWDSATLLTSQMGFLVPHWPPVYPEFLAFNVFWLGFTDAAICAIVVSQHILAVAGAMYVMTAFSGTWRRVVIAVFAGVANYFFVLSHGIYTEALSSAFLFFFFGAAARLIFLPDEQLNANVAKLTLELAGKVESAVPRSRGLALSRNGIVLFVSYLSLVLMTLTRHNMFIFAALIPSLYLLKAPLMVPGKCFKPLVVCLGVSLIAFLTVSYTNEFMCRMLGADAAPKYGRPAVYRLHDLPWGAMPPSEKEHIINGALKRCPDDFSRVALKIMIRDNQPWIGSYKQINALAASFGGKKTADQAMNDAVKAFFLTPNKYLIAAIMKDFNVYMGEDNSAFRSFIDSNALSFATYRAGKNIQPELLRIPMIRNIDPTAYARIAQVVSPSWFDGICRYVPLGILAICISLFGVISGSASRRSLVFVLALAVSALLYASISAAITVVICRYLAPVNAVAWLMLAISIASFHKWPWDSIKRK